MSLLKVQEELAALLMEEPARKAFARSRRGHVTARGLAGRDAKLLASLDPDDVAYFASRRRIDRRVSLSSDLPEAGALAEREGRLNAYFRTHPYALEDPLKEAARLVRWAKADAAKGRSPALLADLAAYEHAHLALRAAKPQGPKPSARPRRGPGVKLLALQHDLLPLLHGHGEAERRRCLVVLARVPGDVVVGEVEPLAFQLLRLADGRRAEAALVAQAARLAKATPAQARRALKQLRREGLLAPARQP